MTHAAPSADLEEIRGALAALDVGRCGEPPVPYVIELRALGVMLNGRSYTVSGYFDNRELLAAEAAKLSGIATGVYVTPNPVNAALLARAANRARRITDREPLTSDSDVIARRWLLIDTDPARPAGISSSDAEHDRAILRVKEIHEALSDEGWKPPIVADSGNGGHLLYQIDLAANDGGLVKRVLEALAFRFDDAEVKVDRTVFNPARIWKLYGTQCRKGDDTADRPHRIARVLSAPVAMEVVSREMLEALASAVPRPETPKQDRRSADFNLEAWIADHNLEVDGPLAWQTGRKWIFRGCPWNPDHRNRSAYLIQHASGAVAAGCHHNGCVGRNWHDLREAVEPGWRNRRERASSASAAEPLSREDVKEWEAKRPKARLDSPWARAISATDFVSSHPEEPDWIATDLLAPGSVTVLASPRGLGKTHVAHAAAIAIATGGTFREAPIRQGRVLLVDRDNSRREVRRRLEEWGAGDAANLRVLTRDDAPPLTDAAAWASFPFADYDVVILDSLSASTEGVEESDGGATGEALAPLLDLARRGPAVLVLANTRKDGEVIRGSGAIGDRADILYEVRDATELPVDPKYDAWWEALPEAGDAAWSARSKRRRRRDDYRLALVSSKFRIGEEPDPWCVEIRLAAGAWSLRDVTEDVVTALDVAKGEVAAERKARIEAAVRTLADRVKDAHAGGKPLTLTQGEDVLREAGLPRSTARTIRDDGIGKTWDTQKGAPGARGGAHPIVLIPLGGGAPAAATETTANTCSTSFSDGEVVAAYAGQARRQLASSEPLGDGDLPKSRLSPPPPRSTLPEANEDVAEETLV